MPLCLSVCTLLYSGRFPRGTPTMSCVRTTNSWSAVSRKLFQELARRYHLGDHVCGLQYCVSRNIRQWVDVDELDSIARGMTPIPTACLWMMAAARLRRSPSSVRAIHVSTVPPWFLLFVLRKMPRMNMQKFYCAHLLACLVSAMLIVVVTCAGLNHHAEALDDMRTFPPREEVDKQPATYPVTATLVRLSVVAGSMYAPAM